MSQQMSASLQAGNGTPLPFVLKARLWMLPSIPVWIPPQACQRGISLPVNIAFLFAIRICFPCLYHGRHRSQLLSCKPVRRSRKNNAPGAVLTLH